MNIKPVNYQKLMEQEIELLSGRRPRLLLHCCCAPCATQVLEKLDPHFEILCYFYNPNIYPPEEYDLRCSEMKYLLSRMLLSQRPQLLIGEYDPDAFFAAAQGLENEPECGKRCDACFSLRLSEAAAEAKIWGCEYFTTCLTNGPMKVARTVNEIGQSFAGNGLKWLPADFKKKGGYLRSVELSKEYGLYRQDYCGCVFSKRDRRQHEPE